MPTFKVYRCKHCGRIYRYGKWLFVKELRPDVAATFKDAIVRGYIEWDYAKQCKEAV